MATPDSVKFFTEDMLQDIPLTLEHIVLKHFRHSPNNNDKLFTDVIIENIRETEFEGTVGTKGLQIIILKCGVGYRTGNGNIRIGGIQKKGYTNITFIPYSGTVGTKWDRKDCFSKTIYSLIYLFAFFFSYVKSFSNAIPSVPSVPSSPTHSFSLLSFFPLTFKIRDIYNIIIIIINLV